MGVINGVLGRKLQSINDFHLGREVGGCHHGALPVGIGLSFRDFIFREFLHCPPAFLGIVHLVVQTERPVAHIRFQNRQCFEIAPVEREQIIVVV